MTTWVVRTSFTPMDHPTWKGAVSHYKMMARLLGINIRWYKGKGRITDPKRYFYWETDNEIDTMAFYLACGDEAYKHGKRIES